MQRKECRQHRDLWSSADQRASYRYMRRRVPSRVGYQRRRRAGGRDAATVADARAT